MDGWMDVHTLNKFEKKLRKLIKRDKLIKLNTLSKPSKLVNVICEALKHRKIEM